MDRSDFIGSVRSAGITFPGKVFDILALFCIYRGNPTRFSIHMSEFYPNVTLDRVYPVFYANSIFDKVACKIHCRSAPPLFQRFDIERTWRIVGKHYRFGKKDGKNFAEIGKSQVLALGLPNFCR